MMEEKKAIKAEYQPKPTIHGAFVKVCADVENVKRDTKGQVGRGEYYYATLESVLDVLQPLLAREELGLAQFVQGDDLVAKLYHSSGAEIEMGRYNLGALIDHQKRGSAITYGRRYQLCAIFGITQEDDDAASAGNVKKNDMTTGKSPQAVYGTATKMKERFAQVKDAISRAVEKDHFAWIQKEIELMRTVDEECAKQLDDAVDARRDVLEASK